MALNENERQNLVAYLDGELQEPAAQALEAKLSFDAGARAEAEVFRKTWALLDYLPRPEPSVNFTHETLERLSALKTGVAPRSAGRRWRRLGLALAWAASLFVALVVGYRSGTWMAGPGIFVEAPITEQDQRIVGNQVLYEQLEDLEFLDKLDKPELFGDEGIGS